MCQLEKKPSGVQRHHLCANWRRNQVACSGIIYVPTGEEAKWRAAASFMCQLEKKPSGVQRHHLCANWRRNQVA
jgi:ribosomal protein L39E